MYCILVANGIFTVSKFIAFVWLIKRWGRTHDKVTTWQLLLLFTQALVNFSLFILSKVRYEDAQDWMWSKEGRRWYINLAAVIIGAVQYYYVFLASVFLFLGLATIGIVIYFVCYKGESANHFFGNGEDDENR